MRDARVIVHLQPDEVLVERGETEGLVRCHRCNQVTEHYVTCPGDDDTNFYLWARTARRATSPGAARTARNWPS